MHCDEAEAPETDEAVDAGDEELEDEEEKGIADRKETRKAVSIIASSSSPPPSGYHSRKPAGDGELWRRTFVDSSRVTPSKQ